MIDHGEKPPINPETFLELYYRTEWWQVVPEGMSKTLHARNVKALQAAQAEYDERDRPLRVLLIHGSGRNPVESCAHEVSSSALLLRTGLKRALPDIPGPVEVDDVVLRQYRLEPCNGCYSTSSAWCHAPCSCFPADGMQELYPRILRADVLLQSTPVNQSMISTRLKTLIDRLISLDGGLFLDADQYRTKDEAFKRQCMALAASGNFSYTPRLAGRVCAYVISSKDQTNILGGAREGPTYAEMVSQALKSSWHDYGCLHPEKWYVLAAANPYEEMQYDKAHYNKQPELAVQAEEMVKQALALARDVRRLGHVPAVDRVNRT
jgi:multimeric flavodoxin WrbA